MKPFSQLLSRLLFTPQRSVKLRLLADYFRCTADPDRGLGLAALAGELEFPHAKAGLIRQLAMSRVDPILFGWSYDFVGDLAETTALIWPQRTVTQAWPRLAEVVGGLQSAPKIEIAGLVENWLDTLDSDGRWALLKLITGGLRIGVSARLAKLAVAQYGKVDVAEIEEIWHGLEPPYEPLFAWLDGRANRPSIGDMPVFRPLMLAHPLEAADLDRLENRLHSFIAEWKWDGIRVQIVSTAGGVRLYSRTGDDIGGSFPEIVRATKFKGVLDGELLIKRGGTIGSFNELQQRLGRKSVSARIMARYPAHVRLYDILFDSEEDLRDLPFADRRQRLEIFLSRERPDQMDLSPLLAFRDRDELDRHRLDTRDNAIEGLMLKEKTSLYQAGRPKGPWWKWKRDPHTVDAVLMYAQRGHGRRSSFYSDYTFGCWKLDGNGIPAGLVPVGKAYFGFTDDELRDLDRWIRNHTVARYGPVREVEPQLVLEIAFDSIHASSRHKSGLAMRFPRIHRIRWDKPAHEADRVDRLEALIG